MNRLQNVPAEKRQLLTELTAQLSRVPGVLALVLGGSYARGSQHAASDLDVGLYYRQAQPFAIEAIREIANRISKDGPPTVTDFYRWGQWVNGGAWIQTAAGKVDFLYRNLDQVEGAIADAEQGIVYHDYPQQPAYGFYSVIYLAETNICIPLDDPQGEIAALKRRVAHYPPRLKEKLTADALWSAEFTLLHARGFAEKGDIYNTVGCLTRTAANLTQALFALNETYFMSDKKVMQVIAGFEIVPPGYVDALTEILARPGANPTELQGSVSAMAAVWQSVVQLTGGSYQPQFNLR
jgi:tetratricopeptide (TPR) repeat protein